VSALYVSVRTASPARASLLAATARLEPVSLVEVLAQAALDTRVDRKYIVPFQLFPAVLARLGARLRVLEIDGRRTFGYESVYFDTPELHSYRHHLQGNRRRFKVRTRTYLDSGDCVLEVKIKGGRSETVKHRIPYPSRGRYHLDDDGRRFVAGHIHWPQAAEHLRPALVDSYHRLTLVDLSGATRITCDTDFTCRRGAATAEGLFDRMLVETKSTGKQRLLANLFHQAGIRPAAISKYCLGIALLDHEVRANPWHRTMRRHFGHRG
jgi:hypothetical protein